MTTTTKTFPGQNAVQQENVSRRRNLQTNCERDGRHCVNPEEYDVYSSPVATEAPSVSPTGTPTVSPTISVTAEAAIVTEAPVVSPGSAPTNPTISSPTINMENEESIPVPVPAPPPSFTISVDSATPSPTNDPTKTPIQTTLAPTPLDTSPPTTTPTESKEAPTTLPTRNPTNRSTVLPTMAPTDSTASPTISEETENADKPASAPSSLESTQAPTITRPDAQNTLAPTMYSTSNANNFPIQPTLPPGAVTTTVPPSSTTCKSDNEGNFGLTIPLYSENTLQSGEPPSMRTNVRIVEYRYQVETTPKFEITADDLQSGILWNIEKSISDILVSSFFPPRAGYLCNSTSSDTTAAQRASRVGGALQNHHRLQAEKGNLTSSPDSNMAIVGLAADPRDLVAEGSEGVTCPFPLYSASSFEDMDVPTCYVIDGELSIFMGSNFNSSDDLSWVDSMVQDELEVAMNTGELDNVDPAISYIRYIPFDATFFNGTGDNDDTASNNKNAVTKEEEPVDDTISSAPAWSWIIASFGFVGLATALAIMAMYRRRQSIRGGNDFDSSVRNSMGAFPAQVEIVDDNSEFDEEIYTDDNDDESEQSSRRRVPKPRHQEANDEYSRSHLDINSTDPNQPIIRPVLDEEAETFINNV